MTEHAPVLGKSSSVHIHAQGAYSGDWYGID